MVKEISKYGVGSIAILIGITAEDASSFIRFHEKINLALNEIVLSQYMIPQMQEFDAYPSIFI